LIYYRKEVYSKKYPCTNFKLVGYNEKEDKIVLDTGNNIKEYVIYYTNADNTYFAYRGKRYYLEEFRFKQ
jgi:hypothetical protein